jgi:hypothetical protein
MRYLTHLFKRIGFRVEERVQLTSFRQSQSKSKKNGG